MRSWISQIRSNETLVTRLFYCRGQLYMCLFLPSMVPVFVHRSTWNMFWTKTDTTATLPFPQRIRSNLKSQEFQTAQSISTFLFEDMSWSVAYIFIRFIHFETAKKNKSLNSRWAKLTNEINCMMYQFLEQNPGGTNKSTDAIPVVHAKVVPNVSAFGKVFVPYFDWFSLIHITGLQRWISTYGI